MKMEASWRLDTPGPMPPEAVREFEPEEWRPKATRDSSSLLIR
jgi:hypothetical protein